MMYHYSHKQERGFSLVETLVAISILLIVIIGPMTISMATARSTSFASEQVTAFFLAQEGAELAQRARDQYLLDYFKDPTTNPTPWTDFLDETASGEYRLCYGIVGCGLELIDGDASGSLATPKDCGLGSGCQVYFDSAGGRVRYTYDSASGSNSETGYTRIIKFTEVSIAGNDDDVKVVSKVTWRSGAFRVLQSVQVETHLLNVYDTP